MPKISKHSKFDSAEQNVEILALFAILVVLSVIASTGSMSILEVVVFNTIYGMSDSLRWFALVVTQFGNGWVVIGIAGLLFVARKSSVLALVVLRNSVLAYIFVEALKFVVDRPRPMLLLSEVSSREIIVSGNGFPSGHTAIATVLGLTLLSYLPVKFRWVPFVWIVLVAWSRIYLGVHAPLDIIGGFIIGLIVVLVADVSPWPQRTKR